MDELVKLVTQKAGISQDQANTAVNTVIGFLKQRLPGPVANELDKVASGGSSGSSGTGGMAREAEEAVGRFAKR